MQAAGGMVIGELAEPLRDPKAASQLATFSLSVVIHVWAVQGLLARDWRVTSATERLIHFVPHSTPDQLLGLRHWLQAGEPIALLGLAVAAACCFFASTSDNVLVRQGRASAAACVFFLLAVEGLGPRMAIAATSVSVLVVLAVCLWSLRWSSQWSGRWLWLAWNHNVEMVASVVFAASYCLVARLVRTNTEPPPSPAELGVPTGAVQLERRPVIASGPPAYRLRQGDHSSNAVDR